ncbi:hypothetical protein ROV96_19325 [Stenotrophomonas pavanii]|uniref:hypothetical protein n=1 Tax=Stenotrophomonas pavanii TaxID=487698 RepID=UPI0028950D21|nr:hypothetical protein [Stenotrophomonas pavanii]MDT3457398.1 hypothetical protein [Stenotrophomonas pavanii]MDT3466090.1 hypothetical protein [Stenotrophomonas pavanii]
MSILEGVFQCSPLSGTCEVWWEAFAAVAGVLSVSVAAGALLVAWLGVGVSFLAAFAVWRLGAEANRLASAPAKAAEVERGRERTVLLSALYGELLRVSSDAGAWHGLAREFGVDHLLDTEQSRLAAAAALEDIDMPLTKSLLSRLHVLPTSESSRLARCLGIVSVLHESVETMKAADRDNAGSREVILRLIGETIRLDEISDEMSDICAEEIYPGAK